MIRSLIVAAFLVLAVTRAGSAAPDGHPPVPCDMPADLVAPAASVAGITASLETHKRLDVLALGSGTLLGQRGGIEGSVPYYMTEALRAAAPSTTVRLTLHGARAATASDMLETLRRELAAHPYQLVIWQTGTVEAVRRTPPLQFADTLAEGLRAVAAANARLILIDMPYSRLLESNSDLQPYRLAMQRVADAGGAILFRRYDLMRHWADSGEIDLEEVGKRERHTMADKLRACLGQALAKTLLADGTS